MSEYHQAGARVLFSNDFAAIGGVAIVMTARVGVGLAADRPTPVTRPMATATATALAMAMAMAMAMLLAIALIAWVTSVGTSAAAGFVTHGLRWLGGEILHLAMQRFS